MSTIEHPGIEGRDAQADDSTGAHAEAESISMFMQECMKEGQGVTIPFEAILQPSRLVPFASILVSLLYSAHGRACSCAGERCRR
jgi:hypothetical protein